MILANDIYFLGNKLRRKFCRLKYPSAPTPCRRLLVATVFGLAAAAYHPFDLSVLASVILLTLDTLMINVNFPPPSEGAAETTRGLTSNSAACEQASEDKRVDNGTGDDPMKNDSREDISNGGQQLSHYRTSKTSLSEDINSKGTSSPGKEMDSLSTMQRAEVALAALYEAHDRFFSTDKEEKHVRTREDTQEHHTSVAVVF